MNSRTSFLGLLLGLFFVLVSLSMTANKDGTIQTVTALANDAPVILTLGLILVAAGIAMILSLMPWSGGALQVVVGIIGALTLIKGLFFLDTPPKLTLALVLWGPFYERFYYVDMGIMFVLGVYLMFLATRRQRDTT